MTIKAALTALFPGVWRLVAPNPSPMTGPGTNTYLVGQDRFVVIDPGPDDELHVQNILTAMRELNGTLQAIVITHPHADHNGAVKRLSSASDAPVLGFESPLLDGDEIKVTDQTLQVRHTPGHIYAHLCLWQARQRLLFAGDLVAGQGTILVIPPDGNMADYFNSLKAMKALPTRAILPGHGPVIDEPQTVLQAYLDHRLAREQQILDRLAQGDDTAERIAATIYADRPEVLPIATLQVEAHLEKLRAEGRA